MRSALDHLREIQARVANESGGRARQGRPSKLRIEDAEITDSRVVWSAVRLRSRTLGTDLWIAKDQETAERVWTETRSAVFLLDEIPRFETTPIDLLCAIANVRAEFGPSARWER